MSAIENVSRRWFLKGTGWCGSARPRRILRARNIVGTQCPLDVGALTQIMPHFIPMCLWVSRLTELSGLSLIARKWAP